MADHTEWGVGLWRMADLTVPMALRVAATLRVADHLTAAPRTAEELARAVRAEPRALDRTLRHLVTAGVLARDARGAYTLTDRGQALRDDHPHGMRSRLDIEGAVGRAELSLGALLHAVRTGELAYATYYGRPFWDDLAADPALSDSFDAVMEFNLRKVAPSVLKAYDWGALARVADVGGGNGALLVHLLSGHPELHGTLVELPGPAAAARDAFARAGLADRVAIVEGSFFDPLPPGADAYLLSDVLHNWDDDAAVTILRRCAQAAGAAGRVLVIGGLGEDGESPSTEMDMRMLAYFGGRERDLAELTGLARRAGLTVAAVHRAADMSVVELTCQEEPA
ncbi:methyltransferase [Streptomyces sp. NPDC006476]|uniref:methyltransferase n=1 Tax=Streptomyces sp. NPDC006476 TaxID=3157175 RepID=UPI0033B7EB9C